MESLWRKNLSQQSLPVLTGICESYEASQSNNELELGLTVSSAPCYTHAQSTPASLSSGTIRGFEDPSTSALPVDESRRYCCTLCGEIHSYKYYSDWRKHEWEHEVTFVCMPVGPQEAAGQYLKCAFCASLNPDDEHLGEHKASACTFTSKRRDLFVAHLSKCHRVHEREEGKALADSWRRNSGKRFWSCGFCVHCFSTFKDRLNHIGSKHLKQGQTLDEWNTTTLILGLLLQPGVDKAWEEKLWLHHDRDRPHLIWEGSAMEDLQFKLEMGPSDTQSTQGLAELAYTVSRVRSAFPIQDDNTFSDEMTTANSPHWVDQTFAYDFMPYSTLEGMRPNVGYLSSADGHGYGRPPAQSVSSLNNGSSAVANQSASFSSFRIPTLDALAYGALQPDDDERRSLDRDPIFFHERGDDEFEDAMSWTPET